MDRVFGGHLGRGGHGPSSRTAPSSRSSWTETDGAVTGPRRPAATWSTSGPCGPGWPPRSREFLETGEDRLTAERETVRQASGTGRGGPGPWTRRPCCAKLASQRQLPLRRGRGRVLPGPGDRLHRAARPHRPPDPGLPQHPAHDPQLRPHLQEPGHGPVGRRPRKNRPAVHGQRAALPGGLPATGSGRSGTFALS